MRTLRNAAFIRAILLFMIVSLIWLQAGTAWADTVRQNSLNREEARLRREAMQRATGLAPGLTQTPDAALRKKIAAREKAAVRPAADVRPLSSQEMKRAFGRGLLRNPYFAGSPMPWHRSLRDVNLCTGNLFKSYTDIQVAPARGAGLVLQRTYSSNDARVGPFGIGWTHAYDIRIQEAKDVQTQSGNPVADGSLNDVPRTDFFGAKHTYHRDADGLYSPPPYLYDEMSSDYGQFLVNGPTRVLDDTDTGMDGTVKHYTDVVTNPSAGSGDERGCDYIQDRYGNKTTLTYSQSYTQPDGSTRKLLTSVTDPTNRSLTFHWTNFGTTGSPAYRITEVDAPTDPSTGAYAYRVTYAYYGANDPAAGGAPYQLKSVTLDPDSLNRTTTYTYTSYSAGYTDQNGVQQTASEYGLLQTVTDPVGNTVTYAYDCPLSHGYSPTDLWVSSIVEPGGVDATNTPRVHTWTIEYPNSDGNSDTTADSSEAAGDFLTVNRDASQRTVDVEPRYHLIYYTENLIWYDSDNNVAAKYGFSGDTVLYAPISNVNNDSYQYADTYTYGQHGNVLTHRVVNDTQYGPVAGGSFLDNDPTYFDGQETTNYYNASQYFQKQSTTDMDGRTTTMGVGTDTAGNAGDPDPNIGDRGQVLWVQDAGYNDSASPSYHKQFTYTYNQYGQKLTETNLNGVVTQYTYGTSGDDLGNLIQVAQDPGGTGHLNRTTTMHYDVMGRVLSSTDPAGLASSFTYNTLGQPKTVVTPARGSAPAETISYVYDGNGRTHSVTDNRGTTTMAYETGCDRVHSVTDPVTGAITYTYNVLGDRTSMTLPGGGTWTYNYQTVAPDNSGNSGQQGEYAILPGDDPDKMGTMLASITDDQGRKVEYGFNPAGRLGAIRFNETYNGNGQLVSYCQTDYYYDIYGNPPTAGGFTHGWLGQIQTMWYYLDANGNSKQRLLSQNSYTYDDAGNRLQNTESTQPLDGSGNPQVDANGNPVLTSRTETYGYDDLNRLSTVNYGDGETQSYAFDAMGNRLSKSDTVGGSTTSTTSTYDAANRLTATTGTGASTYTSDADGNTLTGGGRTNVWDSQNRLVSSTLGGVTSTFTYGADGLRRSSTVNGITTYYVYDGTMLIREMKSVSGTLAPSATYLNGPTGPEYRRDDTAGTVRWYVYDGLGSVVDEFDPVGNLTASSLYDVYGAKRAGGAGTATSRQGFVGALGHVTDSETGLVYMRARYYDPGTGRFTSEDSAKQGGNWFAYCSNNPVNDVDATGRTASAVGTDIFAILGTAATVFAVLEDTPNVKLGYVMAYIYASIATAMFALAVTCADMDQVDSFRFGIAAGIEALSPVIVALITGARSAAEASPAAVATIAIVCCAVEGLQIAGAIASIGVDT